MLARYTGAWECNPSGRRAGSNPRSTILQSYIRSLRLCETITNLPADITCHLGNRTQDIGNTVSK
eukprot:6956839-Ditylum_brightwellii.AAC.1